MRYRRGRARTGHKETRGLIARAAARPLQSVLLLAALLYTASLYLSLGRSANWGEPGREDRSKRLEEALTARANVLRGVGPPMEETDGGVVDDPVEESEGDEVQRRVEDEEGAGGDALGGEEAGGVDESGAGAGGDEDEGETLVAVGGGEGEEAAEVEKHGRGKGRARGRLLPRVDILPSSNGTGREQVGRRGRGRNSKAHRKYDAEEGSEKEATVHRMEVMGSRNRTDKVAFMFLTRGKMPHERIWQKFFRQDEEGRHSVFVHAPAVHKYSSDSLWHGRAIPPKSVVEVAWGEPSMVGAERVLLRYALQDPGIAKFALLSETDIPVQSFECAHRTMTESAHSFVQSYPTFDRMPPKMKQFMPTRHWRKGSQWFVMNREHARLVVDDREHWQYFKRFCTIYSMQPCIADEHYVPTLLALKKAEQTWKLYRHGLTYTKWLDKRPSPETFGKNTAIRNQMMEARRCHYAGEHHSRKTFYPLGTRENCGERLDDETFSGLGSSETVVEFEVKRPCYLFARKFSADIAAKAAATYDSVINNAGAGETQ